MKFLATYYATSDPENRSRKKMLRLTTVAIKDTKNRDPIANVKVANMRILHASPPTLHLR
jgi:hypothetical protein